MNTPLICRNYIDGQWIPAQSGDSFESLNPADWQELIATAPQSHEADVNAAVKAARRAYPFLAVSTPHQYVPKLFIV